MTRKDQNAATRSKPEEAAAQDADATAEAEFMYSEINISGIPWLAALKPEFDEAYTLFRQGNQVKSLKLMNDLVSKYKNTPQSALTLRVYAALCAKVASSVDGREAKEWHLKNALDYAKRAAGMSPNSIDFALFYAYLLFESANGAGVYEEVVKECERALSIENPVDLGGEDSQPDVRVQSMLRRLIQNSNIAIISRWMNGEKSRVFSGRRAVVDPIELRIVQANGVKEVPKKPEARVSAAPRGGGDDDDNDDDDDDDDDDDNDDDGKRNKKPETPPKETEERVIQEDSQQQKKGTDEQLLSDDSQQSDEQKKGTEEQLMSDASTVEKTDEQKKVIEEQLISDDSSEQGDTVEQKKGTEEQLMSDDSEQGDTVEQKKGGTEEQLMSDDSEQGDTVEQKKGTEEQLMSDDSEQGDTVEQKKGTEEQLMSDDSEQGDTVEQKKGTEEQLMSDDSEQGDTVEQKKGTEEQLMSDDSEQGDTVEQKKGTEEQLMSDDSEQGDTVEQKKGTEEQLISDDSEQGDTVDKSDEQKKGTEEQLMSDASEHGDTVEKSDEQKKGTEEQLISDDSSEQGDTVEQKKGTEEQLMPDASEQGDAVEKSDEQQKEIEEQTKERTEEQLMPDASEQGDAVEKSDEQQKEIEEQTKERTEEQLMPDASQQGDAVEKSDEQQKEIEEQTKERSEEQLMPDASQEGDPVKKSKEQRKEIKEKLIRESDVVKTSEEQKKDTTEQLMPEASEQGDVVKKSEEQKKETEVKSKPKKSKEQKAEGNMVQISVEQRKKIEDKLRAEASRKRNDGASKSGSSNTSKSTVKRKGGKAAFPDMPDYVKPYWDSLSSEEKKDLLKIKVSDLKEHFSSSKDREAREVLEEAIFFEEAFNSSWRFWSCGDCDEILAPKELFKDHVMQKHLKDLWPETGSILPETAGDEWVNLLLKCCWEPVDLDAASKLIVKTPSETETEPKRRDLLKRIGYLFQELIEDRSLSAYVVSKVINLALDELKGLACGSAVESEVNQTPLCIRLLGVPELERIKSFLDDVNQSCGMYKFSGGKNLICSTAPVVEITEKIRLEGDGSFFVVDEQSLPCKIADVSTNASDVVFENGVILDSDALLTWIFTGAPSSLSAQVSSWKHAKVRTLQSRKIIDILEKEGRTLMGCCVRKCDQTSYEEAFIVLVNLCLEEGKKKERPDLEKFLEKRCKEVTQYSMAYNVIKELQERIEIIKKGKYSPEEAYAGILTPPNDWREKEHLHQADFYVEAAIHFHKNEMATEECKNDTVIMRVCQEFNRLQDELAAECFRDFRSILLPLVKSFLKARVEERAMILATEKSDAAGAALLAEIYDDPKKDTPEKKKGKKKKQNKKATSKEAVKEKDTESVELTEKENKKATNKEAVKEKDAESVELTEKENKKATYKEAGKEKDTESVELTEKENDKETNEEKSISSAREEEDSGLGSEAASPSYEDGLMQMAELSSDSSDDETLCVKEAYGTGLRNEAGEYNCFLNVIIQSLWHLKWFRSEFMETSFSEHDHVGNPCVICALYYIFLAMGVENSQSGAVAPTPLRVALSKLRPESSFFKEGQMNDASELLGEILKCLHQSSNPACVEDDACVAHVTFGMDISEKRICPSCEMEFKPLEYTAYFLTISAAALRDKKLKNPHKSFEELLKLIEKTHPVTCDLEARGCGSSIPVLQYLVSSPPPVFTAVVGWQSVNESVEDIKDTLDAMSTEVDVRGVYHIEGVVAESSRHCLVSVVCYVGMHYICFVYDGDHTQWMLYDDQSVEVVGRWKDVVTMCLRRTLQPQVLFYVPAPAPAQTK